MSILPLRLSDVGLVMDGRRLLDNISVRFDVTGRTVILGPNGAGKSLLLRLCHGLLTPTEGQIEWASDARRSQGMVFQRPVMLRRSVRANLDYPLNLRGMSRAARVPVVARALASAGLEAFAEQAAITLSGGEQQRLAMVRAQVLEPEVLFLDEPTASLDPAATGRIEAMIRQASADGIKIIMSTHDLGQARRLADNVVFLHNGRLQEVAKAGDFFAGPSTEEARAYLEGRLLW